jgi:hypothetical protein
MELILQVQPSLFAFIEDWGMGREYQWMLLAKYFVTFQVKYFR